MFEGFSTFAEIEKCHEDVLLLKKKTFHKWDTKDGLEFARIFTTVETRIFCPPSLGNKNHSNSELPKEMLELGRGFSHQEFQVPKMEVLNLIRPFWGSVFPYISLTYSLYRWVPPFSVPEMSGDFPSLQLKSSEPSFSWTYCTVSLDKKKATHKGSPAPIEECLNSRNICMTCMKPQKQLIIYSTPLKSWCHEV